MLEKRIKRFLDNIIDAAFPEDAPESRDDYKSYRLSILAKENSSTSGAYHHKNRQIEVYNPSLGSHHLAKTCLHELSHHIDIIKNDRTGHQKPFYEVYAKLIYASLDLGILTEKDFNDTWSSDSSKVKKIIDRYEPHPIEHLGQDTMLIKVMNAFSIKEELKNHGFKWNKLEQAWEKELDGTDVPLLNGWGIYNTQGSPKGAYYSIVPAGMYINAMIYITAEGSTYEAKEVLKEYGFYFNGENKKWICKIQADDKEKLMKLKKDERLNGCRFSISKRK